MIHFLYTKQVAARKSYPIKVGDREYDSLAHAARVLQAGQQTLKKLAKEGGLYNGEPVIFLPRVKRRVKKGDENYS